MSEPPAARLADAMFAQLDRYGVVTRGSVLTEAVEGGFGTAYRALSALEESSQCRRGYFVEGLGAAQFASTGAVDGCGPSRPNPREQRGLVLAACDPANPYGAALPWPEREGHRPGRKPGALVILVNGRLVFYVERGGRTLLSFTDDHETLAPAAAALARAVRLGQLGSADCRAGRRPARLRLGRGEHQPAGGRLRDDAVGTPAATSTDGRADSRTGAPRAGRLGCEQRSERLVRPRPGPPCRGWSARRRPARPAARARPSSR